VDREAFAGRLHDATQFARDFAERFVEERLPWPLAFRVRLNASYDAPPFHPDIRVFPHDSRIDRAELAWCSEEQVNERLWRQGAVPQWINVTAIGATSTATVLELVCCGRFTDNASLLYHEREGLPPFHVLGPSLPQGWVQGQRFSLYRAAECWLSAELEPVRAHSNKVWSLTLRGAVFDDDTVESLPNFECLELLNLDEARLDGTGLTTLDRHPLLRVLRIGLTRRRVFHIRSLASLPRLQRLEIRGLATKPWGFELLAERLANLEVLTLQANDVLHADGPAPPSLRELSVTARDIAAGPRLPRELRSIALHLTAPSATAIEALLEGAEHVDQINLRGTPTSEALVTRLIDRLSPRGLDIVKTTIDKHAVRRIAANHPELRMFPKLGPARS
jgi:hypothetical protein